MTDERPLLIGLSGPIGCGKSAVGKMLANIGGTVLDADELAHQVTAPGTPVLGLIRQRFGDAVFAGDGSLDRAALARLVFADQAALADLEAIIHPEVRRLIDARLAAAAADHVPFVVVEAIKLVEGGLAQRCDEVWLIECLPATQRRRLLERGQSAADAEQRMTAQGSGFVDRLAAQLAALPRRTAAAIAPDLDRGIARRDAVSRRGGARRRARAAARLNAATTRRAGAAPLQWTR